MWLRHDHRPGRTTVVGAAVAAVGLVLVLDLLSGADLSGVGVAWALVAMAGAAVYFVVSAGDSDLPPLVLAAAGLVLATVVLSAAGALGVVPLDVSRADVTYRATTVPFWLPLLGLGVVTAAVAYVSGIAASRRLGPRLASFVGLAGGAGGAAGRVVAPGPAAAVAAAGRRRPGAGRTGRGQPG